MKILITNNHLQIAGGTETWVEEMALALIRMKHEVEVWTPHQGEFSKNMESKGIVIAKHTWGKYDLAIINHNTCLLKTSHLKCPRIFTCHGTVPKMERPIPMRDTKYVAVSKEIEAWMKSIAMPAQAVIVNSTTIPKIRTQYREGKERVLLSICQGQEAIDACRRACDVLGITFRSHLRGGKTQTFDIKEAIADSDIVVSLGRGAVEAMVQGCSTIIFDSRAYNGAGTLADGLVTPEKFDLLQTCNWSGRALRLQYSVNDLVSEIERSTVPNAKAVQQLAFEKLSIDIAAQQYLDL